jgi:predicted ribosome quality control (RQC) complex YloA/Tae2 family protein
MKSVKFRKFCTSSGKDIVCGKDAEQNELVVAQSGENEVVLHTLAAGSPFCNIKGKATPADIKETAVICAAFSKTWKAHKGDVVVHVFRGKDIFKDAEMKTGTFGVRKAKSLTVKKENILRFLEAIRGSKE